MLIKKALIAICIIFSAQAVAMNTNTMHIQFSSSTAAQVRCPMCKNDVNTDQVMRLQCSHLFCFDCLLWQLKAAACQGNIVFLRCMVKGCRHKFSEDEIETIENRDQPGVQSGTAQRLIVRCPTPDCLREVIIDPRE